MSILHLNLNRFDNMLLAVHLHIGSTRKDLVTQFTEREIAQLGANGRDLIDFFIPELAYKLGFTPKYGS